MELNLNIIGILLIVLALIHVGFPRYFQWKQELPVLSLVNRQMMVIHTFFLALIIFLMGLFCFMSADLLVSTRLGKQVCLGLAVFWTIRWFVQFFGYSSALWKGKRLETTIHIIFSLLWTYLSVVFWWVGLS